MSMVTLNIENPIGRGVKLNGTAAEAWKSLADTYDTKLALGLVNAEAALAAI
ncbi:hypothetical protein C0991_004579, partial [Blastosporella zonata]